MSDLIKIRLSGNKWREAREKGADYIVFKDNDCIFYDKEGEELWREKDSLRKDFQSENNEQ